MSIGFALFGILTSAAITLALCRYAMPICRWLDLLDIPDKRKSHVHPTPLMGGISLQAAAVPQIAIVAIAASSVEWTQHLLVFGAAIITMTMVGLADDRHNLTARDRLMVSFLVFGSAAIIDPLFNVRVLHFEHPAFELGLGTGWLAVIFTTICCVGLVNAVNMADGKNGLVIGLCLGWLALLGSRAPSQLIPAVAILAVSLTVLLAFNLRGKLFLGDGGAYGLSTAIGLIAIATYNSPGVRAGRAIAAEEIMLLFSVPVIDSFRLTFLRLRRGQSPMAADRDHLHHYFDHWLGWPDGLIVYLCIALGGPALLILGKG